MPGRGKQGHWVGSFNREELIWAAGLFEGEGCITHNICPSTSRSAENPESYHSIKLVLGSTDEDVVQRFYDAVGRLGRPPKPTWKQKSTKQMYIWNAHGYEPCQAILAMFYPWLGIRRRARMAEILKADNTKGLSYNYDAAKTHCVRGHEYTIENTIIDDRGKRQCKTCQPFKWKKGHLAQNIKKARQAGRFEKAAGLERELADLIAANPTAIQRRQAANAATN